MSDRDDLELIRKAMSYWQLDDPAADREDQRQRIFEGRQALDRLAARLERLEKALKETCDTVIWMSGSNDFAPGAEGHEPWKERRELLYKALPLVAPPSSGELR